MNLIDKQKTFSRLLGKLLCEIYARGYEATMAECWRPPEMAKLYAQRGLGINQSLHEIRLAVDLNLFKNNKYLTRSTDYEELGIYWESLSEAEFECCWGGRFKNICDGNHFSITHDSIK